MPERRPVSFRVRRRVAAMLISVAVVHLTAACRSTRVVQAPATVSADTFAVVDGRPITRDDVEKAYRRTRDTSQPLSDDETLTAKLALLNDLIVQDLLIAKARELKIELPDTELDAAYNDAKKNLDDQAFQQELGRRNLTAADMRDGLRRELLTQKVIDREVVSKITVTDQQVTDYFNANKSQFNIAEEAYHIAQIVVTPARDTQVNNGTGDDAATPQAAAAKVQMLMDRLKAGASFSELAMGYSEDPESAPRGGDLGFVPISRLRQAPAPLRDAVLNKTPGSVNVATAGGVYTVVLVVAHENAGQRDLSTPAVRDRIVETLRGRRAQLVRAAYLTAIRANAKVENHLARRVVDAQGKVQGVAPLAP